MNDNYIEKLSEEVHNAWMKEKIAQGFHAPLDCPEFKPSLHTIELMGLDVDAWIAKCKFSKFCPKCHTDIYPYSELPENIKEYDRVTVRAVLSAIEKLKNE